MVLFCSFRPSIITNFAPSENDNLHTRGIFYNLNILNKNK